MSNRDKAQQLGPSTGPLTEHDRAQCAMECSAWEGGMPRAFLRPANKNGNPKQLLKLMADPEFGWEDVAELEECDLI